MAHVSPKVSYNFSDSDHLTWKQKDSKMDLINIFSLTTLLILISISGVRSATVTLSKSADKGQLGNNSLLLYCDYSLSAEEFLFSVTLKRKRADDSSFNAVVSYYEDNKLNATYLQNGLDLVGRTVLTNPTSANRKAMLQFSSIQCTDEADYQCELIYAAPGQGNFNVNSSTRIVVTAKPMFGNHSLLYTPSTNLAENQNVTFTCIGNVGREPEGTFSWYRYVRGQAPGMVITNGIKPVSLTNVAGSCTYVRSENLILTLTKEDNQMVIRCTAHQTETTTEAGDGNIQTDRISVYYVPRINLIGSDPDFAIYSEGLAQLLLTCNADSNPPSNYVWTLPDGTVLTGYQLRLANLTTNHTGWYTCMAYTGWGVQNYTANKSINIRVVATTTPALTATTTTTRSSTTVSVTKTPGTAANSGNNATQAENTSSTLFAILFGVVLGISVFLVTILSICLHKQRMLATDLKQQLQTRSNTYDGLNMRLTTPEPYAALTVKRSEDSQRSSAYSNPYEGLHRTLESSEPYDSLERRI